MKRKDFMKLGVMFVCFSLAAGVPVFAAEQQPATKWQYTQKQEQDGILCVFDELKLKLPETWNGKLGMLKNIYITYSGVIDNRAFKDFFTWPRNYLQLLNGKYFRK